MTDSYILFDVPPGADVIDREFLEQSGHPVMLCHGPQPGGVCPLLTNEGCALAEDAHGIVFELDLDLDQHRAILARYKDSLRNDIPIHVAVQPGQVTTYADLLMGLKVWNHPPVAGDLDAMVVEVEAADG